MDICYEDLTREAQQRLLNTLGISSPDEVDWDDDTPIATVEIPDILDIEEDDEEE